MFEILSRKKSKEKLRKSRHRWDANIKMGLEDVECDAEGNLEVVWDIMAALAIITCRINALCLMLVVG